MNIEFKCPQCGKAITTDAVFRGEVVECPHCEKGIVVPGGMPKNTAKQHSTYDLNPRLSHSGIRERQRPTPPNGQLPVPSISIPQTRGDKQLPTRPQRPVMSLPPNTNHEESENPNMSLFSSRRVIITASIICIAVVIVACFASASLALKMAIKQVSTQSKTVMPVPAVDFAQVLTVGNEREERLGKRLDGLKGEIEGVQAEIRGAQASLKYVQAEFKKDIDGISERITRIVAGGEHSNEYVNKQNMECVEKCDKILRQVEEALKRISSFTAMQVAKPVTPIIVQQLPIQPQTGAQDQPGQPETVVAPGQPPSKVEPPKETLADLRRQLKRNIAEINQLREKNPACFISPKSSSSIINTEIKIPTKADQLYFTRNRKTYVRKRFYCSACNKELTSETSGACCNVSGQRSFGAWLDAKENVEVTEKIYARINELYKENATLRQKMRTAQE